MELKHIKELMAMMGRTGTKRLEFKKEGVELVLERGDQKEGNFSYEQKEPFQPYHFFPHPWSSSPSNPPHLERMSGKEIISPSSTEGTSEDLVSLHATSPMVGTYYSAPSPDQSPFVKVGDKIEKNVTIIGIIEAMKVMNEIKSNVSGTVVEIVIESGHPVEFGTKLLRVVE